MIDKKAAVIDLGTNTFHLLMVELSGSGFDLIYKEKIPVKLGQGGISINTITPEAQERAFHTIGHFKHLIDAEKIDRVYVFATSAVRNASNRNEFVKEIQKRFGLKVNVIDGDHEAQLIYEGIKFSGSLNSAKSLMMDIGGGSVEFIIGDDKEVFWKQSFEIGGQRLLDLFPYHDPILPKEVEKLKQFLDIKLVPLIEAIRDLNPTQLIGASGTFDTLTDIYCANCQITRSKKQRDFNLPKKAFEKIFHQLILLNREERLKIPGMIAMRVDMIVVAACLIEYVLDYFDVPEITCSTYALKEGVIAQLVSPREAMFIG
jgi:exopolyphosphatase/guanosine-5'-triphosphate,3'-diphosphate pyrophosphatase